MKCTGKHVPPCKRHISFPLEFSIPLLSWVALALAWSNLFPESYHQFIHEPLFGPLTFHFLTYDIFMMLFFGIAAAESNQSCLPGGATFIHSTDGQPVLGNSGWSHWAGTGLFWSKCPLIGNLSLVNGWGIPLVTDIALAWLIARIVRLAFAVRSFHANDTEAVQPAVVGTLHKPYFP